MKGAKGGRRYDWGVEGLTEGSQESLGLLHKYLVSAQSTSQGAELETIIRNTSGA